MKCGEAGIGKYRGLFFRPDMDSGIADRLPQQRHGQLLRAAEVERPVAVIFGQGETGSAERNSGKLPVAFELDLYAVADSGGIEPEDRASAAGNPFPVSAKPFFTQFEDGGEYQKFVFFRRAWFKQVVEADCLERRADPG